MIIYVCMYLHIDTIWISSWSHTRGYYVWWYQYSCQNSHQEDNWTSKCGPNNWKNRFSDPVWGMIMNLLLSWFICPSVCHLFQMLESSSPGDEEFDCSIAQLSDNMAKNRITEHLPRMIIHTYLPFSLVTLYLWHSLHLLWILSFLPSSSHL